MNLGTTIKVAGGLLPPQLLERIAAGDITLPGMAPADFHEETTVALNQAINRAWSVLTVRWTTFRAQLVLLPEADRATALTRDKWLLPLFQELGYGRLSLERAAIVADERPFAISHRWGHVPIHLVGARLSLDKRVPGERGAAASPPHGLVQDLLNHADGHLWAMLSNGLELRLLRDHRSLTRQAYLSFDLEAMFDGEQFSAFRLLYLLCHQSRVEGDDPRQCWLERWVQHAQEDGVRALDRLRAGVEAALTALGRGFIRHRSNDSLKARLGSGALSTQDYYRQLLKLVYRLIFLFVAEDRDLLLVPDAPLAARDRYRRLYATRRLRSLAMRRRGGPHDDGWQALNLVMRQLEKGNANLALPALGSFLWSTEVVDGNRVSRAIPDLEGSSLANEDLYAALAALCMVQDGPVRRPVDWAGVQSDELGSVYEALMERVPRVNLAAGAFELASAAGNERKTTGSYYTPTPVVDALLDLSLDRALDAAVRTKSPEQAILDITVVDPACGSGHFLVAAARRIAHRLARVRCGGSEPSPPEVQHALRDVVSHCIYGVDLNPMAVELCKVSLWMEAIEPGRPLSFLDGHIRHGNALIGTTLELMDRGIPDAAWEALEGDDKAIARQLRDENGRWRQIPLVSSQTETAMEDLARLSAAVESTPDDTADGLVAKELAWRGMEDAPQARRIHELADLWCAAFLWPKSSQEEADAAPIRRVWEQVRQTGTFSAATRAILERLRAQYHFFHWPIAFPTVFNKGGFTVVFGNPPWDTLSPDAKEFFSQWRPEIRQQARAAQQQTINDLTSDPVVSGLWADHRRTLFGWVHYIKQSGRYSLFAEGNLGKGDFNVYRMFVETALRYTQASGFAAQVVPDGFYSGANTAAVRRYLLEEAALDPLLAFENTAGVWFPGVHRSQKFCLYCAKIGARKVPSIRARFGIRTHQDLAQALAGDLLRVPVDMVREFSPEALSIMEFGSQLDIDIVAKMYARWPKFGDESAGSPIRQYMAEVHMGNDRELFGDDPSGVPLYEGRMVSHYDHRAKGYRAGRGRSADWEDLPFGHPEKAIQPQWYISADRVPAKTTERMQQFRIGFCDVTGATNERTFMAAMIPPGSLAGHTLPTILVDVADRWILIPWLACINSFAVDYLARQKVSNHMTYGIVDSLPIPRLPLGHPLHPALALRVLALTCTGREMIPLWNEMSHQGWVPVVADDTVPPGELDEERRVVLIAELEVLVARDLYGLNLDEALYILGTFPIVQRRQEKVYGSYRTRDLVEAKWASLPLQGAQPADDIGQAQGLLRDVLRRTRESRSFPLANEYRNHADARVRDALQQLCGRQEVDLHVWGDQPVRVRPTLKGLRVLDTEEVRQEVQTARALLPVLQRRYQLAEGRDIATADIAREASVDPRWASLVLAMIDSVEVSVSRGPDGACERVRLSTRVQDLDARSWPVAVAGEGGARMVGGSMDSYIPQERLELARHLARRLAQGGSCALIGPRRSGKTTIARLVAESLSERSVLNVNLRADAPSVDEVAWSNPAHLARLFDPTLKDGEDAALCLRKRWMELPKNERPIVVMDEIAGLAHVDISAQPSTFGWLRGLGQDGASLLYLGSWADWRAVMKAARGEPGSSFGNDVEFFYLRPLSDAAATEFVGHAGLRPDQTTTAVRIGGRWPFGLRIAAEALQRASSEGGVINDEELIQGLLIQWRSSFESMWSGLSREAQVAMRSLLEDSGSSREWSSMVRKAAEDEGIVDHLGEVRVLTDNPLLCQWFRRLGPEGVE